MRVTVAVIGLLLGVGCGREPEVARGAGAAIVGCPYDSAGLERTARAGLARFGLPDGDSREVELLQDTLPGGATGARRAVITASWRAPDDGGVLILADCQGDVRDVASTGRVLELAVVTPPDGRTVLQVVVESPAGTGALEKRVHLFLAEGDSLHLTRSGLQFEGV